MTEYEAAEQLAALSHPARLRVLRALMAAGTEGAAAGELARAADLAANATTFHLNRLRLAGLANRQRMGRHVRYTADFAAVQGLLDFLGDACCSQAEEGGRCGPVCAGEAAATSRSHGHANEESPQ